MKRNMRTFILNGLCAIYVFGMYINAEEVHQKLTKPLIDKKLTHVYFSFDKLGDEAFPNTITKKSSPKAIPSGVIETPDGLFGHALNTPNGAYVSTELPCAAHNTMTVEFWLKTGLKNSKTVLLDSSSSNSKKGWSLTLDDQNILIWRACHAGNEAAVVIASRSLPKNAWSKISLVFGSIPSEGGVKGYRMYINNQVAGEHTCYWPIVEDEGKLIIKTPPQGAIDELAISFTAMDIHPVFDDATLSPRNMDFEEGSQGWIGVHDDCVIGTNVKHSGDKSLKIETDTLCTREYLSPMFSVIPGATYNITFWAKVDRFEKGVSAIGLWIRWYFAPEETCSFGGDLAAHCLEKGKTFDWKKFEAEVTVPSSKEFRDKIRWARFQVKNYHSMVKAWIDDIKIVKK